MLGSSAAIPSQKRACASQWITCNNRSVLIDCGEGTQMQLRKFGIHFQRIGHILISHLHGDHFLGLPGLLSTMNLLGRNQGLKVYGPAPLQTILETFFQLSDTQINFNYEFIPVKMKERTLIFEDTGMRIWAFPLKHRIETYGYSIEEKQLRLKVDKAKAEAFNLQPTHFKFLSQGIDFELMDGTKIDHSDFTLPTHPNRMYSYCSDTAPFEKLASHLTGTTTLYHEATFLESEKARAIQTFHSTAMDGAQIAKSLGVKNLLLGHLSSRYPDGQKHTEEAKTIFQNSETVEDGQTYEIL